MVDLMATVYEGLAEYYQSGLIGETGSGPTKGEIFLAVMPSYVDTGNDQADYETLRDAVESAVKRTASRAPGI